LGPSLVLEASHGVANIAGGVVAMTSTEFAAALGSGVAEASFIQLEDGDLIELEDSSGFLELEA
jgi:hypothetical protein